ncbi:MAG TPA: cupin domain-containing protein, partial [Tepidisphaeraceae bacterium]|nr:cupin domain-containing protein [Tepidisphaeraceae bacterium]
MINPIVLQPGEGRKLWLVGDQLTIKLDASQTGGAYSTAVTWTGPGLGPPPHVHHREDELFYVLEGELSFTYDRQSFNTGPGTAVYLKKGVPHAFANKTAAPAMFLLIAVPSGFEEFAAECGTAIDKIPSDIQITPAAIEKLLAVAPKYGIQVLPDHRAECESHPP